MERMTTMKDGDTSQLAVSEVRSKAVVKYSSIDSPARFQELQVNTDLNNPPSNWLHGRSKWESYIQNASLSREHAPFSSFQMANCYPDLAGDIDVVSDSENIKKLLKLAYSKSNISMMVHRIGNTLMLDEFDIHRYLLRQQDDDWKWLRRFFFETVLQNMEQNAREKCVIRKNKTRDINNRNMLSKFLYYSMSEAEPQVNMPAGVGVDAAAMVSPLARTPEAMSKDEDDSEDDNDVSETFTLGSSFESPHSAAASRQNTDTEVGSHIDHQRTVVWTFENIHMLIGTDLPIFGGNTHPCVSLRLCEMSKPINVLTGIDYWLDNLICNVPELAMCYHDNGIVQSYELIKTEEIPNLDNSKFSPHVIRDVAQNILSFLKSNATKEGHTYWLFKGYDDEIVKLYDLTTLCGSMMDDVHDNPFTVPVGVLLYRVARNMHEKCPQKSNVICALLKNCLTLLDVSKHAQMAASAYYLLSDIYVSNQMDDFDTVNDQNGEDADDQAEQASSDADDDVGDIAQLVGDEPSQLSSNPADASVEADSALRDAVPRVYCDDIALVGSSMEDGEKSVLVKALCGHDPMKKSLNTDQSVRYPPITGSPDEHCIDAANNIVQGLRIVHRQTVLGSSSTGVGPGAEERQAQCDPNKAIPLHYHPLREQNLIFAETLPPDADSPLCTGISPYRLRERLAESTEALSANDWCKVLKVMLVRKASVVCFKLAKSKVASEQFGLALNLARQALYCFAAVRHAMPSLAGCDLSLLAHVASLCGDIQRGLARCQSSTLRQHLKDISDRPTETAEMMDLIIDKDIARDYEYLCEFTDFSCVESCLQKSIDAYSVAVDSSNRAEMPFNWLVIFKQQLGNALNELGIHFMNEAAARVSQPGQSIWIDIELLSKKSLDCFSQGIASFDEISDAINASMLYSNCGKVYRLCARAVVDLASPPSKKHEFSTAERHFLEQAVNSYSAALEMLSALGNTDKMIDSLKQSIAWDLSSVYYTTATLLQDYAPVSSFAQQQIETEVASVMEKALKYCKEALKSAEGHQLFMVQYRVANINHRLASLFHNALRGESDGERRKNCRLKAESHYEIAFNNFMGLSDVCCLDPIRVQLERVALCELQLSNQTSSVNRVKTLERSLDFLIGCRAPLMVVLAQLQDQESGASASSDTDGSQIREETAKLLSIIEARLRATLLALVKDSLALSKQGHKDSVQFYKSLYALSLTSAPQSSSIIHVCNLQCNVLNQISMRKQSSELKCTDGENKS